MSEPQGHSRRSLRLPGKACSASACCVRRGCELSAQSAGVTVTLIDFTLSRLLTAGGEAVFCNLAADPEIFKGPKGDVQVGRTQWGEAKSGLTLGAPRAVCRRGCAGCEGRAGRAG